jgi:hypothetical protein
MILPDSLIGRRRPDPSPALAAALPVDPERRIAEDTLAAVVFDPAFTAAVDAALKETPQ